MSAVFVGLSVWFFLTNNSGQRLRLVSNTAATPTSQPSMSISMRRALLIAGGALIGWTFGDIFGVVVGVISGLWVLRMWRSRDSMPTVRNETAFTRDSPVMLDLLSAALASGATIRDSMEAVRDAMSDSPVAETLTEVIAAVDLGADPREAWVRWIKHPVLGGLAQAIVRSHDSGAALVEVLESNARELRREHQRRVEVAARSAGVKAVIPLAACFLPAFFALGVVPVVASLATSTGFLGY